MKKSSSRGFSSCKLAKFVAKTTDLRDLNGLKDHITQNIGISMTPGDLEEVFELVQIQDLAPSGDDKEVKKEVKTEPVSEEIQVNVQILIK